MKNVFRRVNKREMWLILWDHWLFVNNCLWVTGESTSPKSRDQKSIKNTGRKKWNLIFVEKKVGNFRVGKASFVLRYGECKRGGTWVEICVGGATRTLVRLVNNWNARWLDARWESGALIGGATWHLHLKSGHVPRLGENQFNALAPRTGSR